MENFVLVSPFLFLVDVLVNNPEVDSSVSTFLFLGKISVNNPEVDSSVVNFVLVSTFLFLVKGSVNILEVDSLMLNFALSSFFLLSMDGSVNNPWVHCLVYMVEVVSPLIVVLDIREVCFLFKLEVVDKESSGKSLVYQMADEDGQSLEDDSFFVSGLLVVTDTVLVADTERYQVH